MLKQLPHQRLIYSNLKCFRVISPITKKHDKITHKMVKQLSLQAVEHLIKIFNAMARISYFPNMQKTSVIITVAKPGKDPTQVASYRPISQFPTLSKVFEKLVASKILTFLTSRNIVPDHQSGFRKNKRSTTKGSDKLLAKKHYSAVFLDIAQAIRAKRTIDWLPANIYDILDSNIKGRLFRLRQKSSKSKNQSSVPQGSVLEPVLYLIYIFELSIDDNLIISTFSEDTDILSSHKNLRMPPSPRNFIWKNFNSG